MKYKPYPAYKDSGVEWLGEIPEEWDILRFGLVAAICNGADFKAIETFDSGYAVYGSGGRFAYASQALFSGPSVLLGRKGTIDRPLYVDQPFWTSDTMFYTRFGDLLYPKFAFYFATTIPFGYYQTSTALPSMTQTDYGSMRIPLPSLVIQRAITAFLDTETARIDGLVNDYEELIALLREKRQALVSHAVTRGLSELVSPDDPEFGEWAKPVKFKNSGVEWLGEIPEGWQLKRLKQIALINGGIAKGSGTSTRDTITVPYLRASNVQDGHLDLSEIAEIEIDRMDLGRYLLRPSDVLMNEGGDNDKLGRGAIWKGSIDPCIHQNHVFRVRAIETDPEWIDCFTNSTHAKYYFQQHAKQSTNLASISMTNLSNLLLTIPCERLQRAIVLFVTRETVKLDTLVAEAESAIALLKEHRAALITNAVTGKINVEDWEEESRI